MLKVKVPLFGSKLWVYIGAAELERFKRDCEGDFTNVSPTSDGLQCGSYLWLRELKIGVFAHEIVHYVKNVVEHIGIEDTSGEVEAYIMGWAIDEVWPKLEKRGKK